MLQCEDETKMSRSHFSTHRVLLHLLLLLLVSKRFSRLRAFRRFCNRWSESSTIRCQFSVAWIKSRLSMKHKTEISHQIKIISKNMIEIIGNHRNYFIKSCVKCSFVGFCVCEFLFHWLFCGIYSCYASFALSVRKKRAGSQITLKRA